MTTLRGQTIIKSRRDWEVVPHLYDYHTVCQAFSWDRARQELDGLPEGGGLNMAHEAVDRHAAGPRADHLAIRWIGKKGEQRDYTYKRLCEQTNRFANVLARLGVVKGDRVYALAGRIPELYIAALGALKHRCVFSPLFSAFGPEPIRARLTIGQARVLITTESLYQRKVAGLRAALPHLEHVLLVGDARQPTAVPDTKDFYWLMAEAGDRFTVQPTRPEDEALLHFTSGTTGTPKGAKRSADGGAPALAAMFERIPWRAEEPVVVAAPMFHAWGFGQLAIAAATTCTIITRRRFDPEATLQLVEEHGATGLAIVPVMLERIIDLPDEVLDRYPCRTLRFATASGSRMRPEAVTAFMDRFGDVICNSYNATEAGLISTATPADLRVAPDTAGRPVRGTDVVLLDDAGRPVPTGEVGRICVRSGSQFSGYTSGTTKEFHQDHMVSGDVGRLDADGRLFVVGRDDDMIVSGGENVYPLEVEKLLDAHPQVHETAVVGVEDEAFGQRLAAYVVLRPGADLDADGVRAHVKANLAGYKVPRDVVLLDELPRNATGKVMKRLLPAPGGAADLPGS